MVIFAEQSVVAIFMKTRDEVRHFYWIFSQNSPKLALTWSLVSTRQNFRHNFQLLSFFLHGFILSIIPFSIIESLSYISWLSCTVPPLLNYLVLFGWLMILWHCIILYIVRHCRSFGKWSEACAERINRLVVHHCANIAFVVIMVIFEEHDAYYLIEFLCFINWAMCRKN